MNQPTRVRSARGERAAYCMEPALALAARGFAVFPLRPGTKIPAVPRDWEGLASADAARVREIMRPGRANIGVACGPSRLLVLDLDIAKRAPERGGEPRHGADSLRALAAGRPLPPTFTVSTPSGGLHLYYARPDGVALRNTVGRLGPLIDTRGIGGYVVGPGSRLGALRYEIVSSAPVAPLPAWLVDALQQLNRRSVPDPVPSRPVAAGPSAAAYGAAALRNEVSRVRMARIGTRNDTLNRAAFSLGRLVGAGLLDRGEAERALLGAASNAGLGSGEAAATLASGLRAGIARPREVAVSSRARPPSPPRSAVPSPRPARSSSSGRPNSVQAPPQSVGADTRRVVAAPPIAVTKWRPDTQPGEFERSRALADSGVMADQGALADSGVLTDQGAADPREQEADMGTERLVGALRELDHCYDAAARCAAPLAADPDWRRVRLAMEVLRDQRDAALFEAVREPGPWSGSGARSWPGSDSAPGPDANPGPGSGAGAGTGTVQVHRVAAMCERVSIYAHDLSARFPASRRRSPLGAALRELRRAADAAAACARDQPASAGPVAA